MGHPVNQLEFEWRGAPRDTAVHLKRSQNVLIPQRNAGRPKNVKSKLQGIPRNRVQVFALCRQDNGDDIPYLNVDSFAQFVKNPGER